MKGESRWEGWEDEKSETEKFLSSTCQTEDNPRLGVASKRPRRTETRFEPPTSTLVPRGLWFLPSIPRTTMRFSANGVAGLEIHEPPCSYIVVPRQGITLATRRNHERRTSSHVNTFWNVEHFLLSVAEHRSTRFSIYSRFLDTQFLPWKLAARYVYRV